MKKITRLGIVLLLIGLFIPSITYPYISWTNITIIVVSTGAKTGYTYEPTFRDYELVIVKDSNGNVAIPYKHIITFGIILSFIGLLTIELSFNKTID